MLGPSGHSAALWVVEAATDQAFASQIFFCDRDVITPLSVAFT